MAVAADRWVSYSAQSPLAGRPGIAQQCLHAVQVLALGLLVLDRNLFSTRFQRISQYTEPRYLLLIHHNSGVILNPHRLIVAGEFW